MMTNKVTVFGIQSAKCLGSWNAKWKPIDGIKKYLVEWRILLPAVCQVRLSKLLHIYKTPLDVRFPYDRLEDVILSNTIWCGSANYSVVIYIHGNEAIWISDDFDLKILKNEKLQKGKSNCTGRIQKPTPRGAVKIVHTFQLSCCKLS